ncbi:MAG: glucose-1-phosphate adenylyltransferase [Chloroflexi bacterium]|nr:glucose-1-phosphate adenylyltransferase [Chloroflexota bacterium]MCI0579578.1 glucose-1-phosphate adenylyltransferase [Chloroflexota bacterium]MCI0644333.1 glucose-1-phosphate adenylyltransferase [Chloroflexota bacterium]MCI0725136.1 glucose-1-phosphate adenylyltransferase [Chloroflexota bacterium]
MDVRDVLAVILGGGISNELYPLTRDRTVPAIPMAGKYRLIDVPMSNCFHAGIERIAVLTQFNSASLHRHIHRTYWRDIFTGGWVQILAAEQTPETGEWYLGTADAFRKQTIAIRAAGCQYTLILSSDHLYLMDYRKLIQRHLDMQADVTIAAHPVARAQGSSFGILKLDPAGQVTRFVEKPQHDDEWAGLESGTFPGKPYMASMGIYVFNTDTLFAMLETNSGTDFGWHIIPAAIETQRVIGYVFDDYWEDVGTIRRFYEANLDMAAPLPRFNLYDPVRPIYTRPLFLPGSKVEGGSLHSVLLADGCRIREATIRYSVVGLRSIVYDGVTIHNTIVMGADYYESPEEREENRRLGRPDMGIGTGSVIDGAIIDKNSRIGQRVIVRHIPGRPNEDHENWLARDGIVIVPKNAIIPDGTVI